MADQSLNNEYSIGDLPFSLEAEQSVLGSILIDSNCIELVVSIIKPDYFYLPQHKAIYASMMTMYAGGMGMIDPVLLADALTKDGVYDKAGGRKYLLELSQIVPSTANIESYATIVKEKYYLRTLIAIAQEIGESAREGQGSASQILDQAEQRLYDIRQGKETGEPTKLSEVVYNQVIDKLEKLNSADKDQFKGIPSGFSTLDKYITGLNKSDLILIGARPGMGKTAFALNLARNVSSSGKKKILFFSLEMNKSQLAERLLASEALVESQKFRTGELSSDEWLRVGAAAASFVHAELYLDDTASITVPEIKSRIRRLRDVDMIVIDYLGLMQSGKKTENRVQEVSEITRGLKMIAKEMNIPVVCCAQLSRGTEARGKSHKPQLSDLRESGSIEQDADIVLFIYRDEYYNNEDDDSVNDVAPGRTELIVAKNRHGAVGEVNLHFDKDFTRFTTLDEG